MSTTTAGTIREMVLNYLICLSLSCSKTSLANLSTHTHTPTNCGTKSFLYHHKQLHHIHIASLYLKSFSCLVSLFSFFLLGYKVCKVVIIMLFIYAHILYSYIKHWHIYSWWYLFNITVQENLFPTDRLNMLPISYSPFLSQFSIFCSWDLCESAISTVALPLLKRTFGLV